MRSISRRLLSVLQLTRMALVFTAIADSQCELLLGCKMRRDGPPPPKLALAIGLVSIGLYGFGMSLNDIIDRRRDAQIASGRPLPSGRIGIVTAHVICFLLAGTALLAGAYYFRYFRFQDEPRHGLLSFMLVALTGMLIAFYDLAGKYLVGLGLLSLGLIRFFHCVIPSPELPVLWHPLLLLNHVTILSTVAYAWEEKRPPLTKVHWWGVLGGLAFIDLLAIGVIGWRRTRGFADDWPTALKIQQGLMLPAAAAMLFVALAAVLRNRTPGRRAAGQKLMLYGLLWLIVYDASFVAVYVSILWGLILLALLPVAYLAVQLMRGWAQMIVMSQKPRYRRAGEAEQRRGQGDKGTRGAAGV
jgi:hypothetical protein